MENQEGTFSGYNGLELFYQCWLPDEAAKATLIVIHGFGEHSGRYMNVVNHMILRGFAVYALDHRGHGRSPGQRGHINNFAEFHGDVKAFVSMVGEHMAGTPLFIMGHSMGGLITLDYVLRHPEGLQGVISSAPGLGIDGVPTILLFLASIMSRVWPSFSMDAGLDVHAVSRDPAVIKAYENDPLVHGKASARLSTEMQKAGDWCIANAHTLQLPLLMIVGTADILVSQDAIHHFYNNVTNPDKKIAVYEDGRHENHNDIHYEEVVGNIGGWLEQRVTSSK